MTEAGGHLAVILMNLFFAVTGASGRIDKVLSTAPRLFLFSALQLLVHFLFLMGVGRGVLKLPLKELLLASNANVGGPTTAAAMVRRSKKLKRYRDEGERRGGGEIQKRCIRTEVFGGPVSRLTFL